MDPKTMQILKEWRENMRQAQAMEFALVAEASWRGQVFNFRGLSLSKRGHS